MPPQDANPTPSFGGFGVKDGLRLMLSGWRAMAQTSHQRVMAAWALKARFMGQEGVAAIESGCYHPLFRSTISEIAKVPFDWATSTA